MRWFTESHLWSILLCAPMAVGCGLDPFTEGPAAGNPDGTCAVPAEAQAEDSSRPDQIVGNGTEESCTGEAFINAVAAGGVITFNCGPNPVRITLERTAVILAGTGRKVQIDGGGRVALSGGGRVRILSLNACDPSQGWSASDCGDAEEPQLTVQNLTFLDGRAKGLESGGGALFVRGARLKVVGCRFFRNLGDDGQWDGGGGAIRAEAQAAPHSIYVVNSTFGGGDGLGNVGSNGGAISSNRVSSITVLNSLFISNSARPYLRSAGGGIYSLHTDTLNLCGVRMTDNHADDGGAVWFGGTSDSTGATGVLGIVNSTLRNNPSRSDGPGLRGVDAYGKVVIQSLAVW